MIKQWEELTPIEKKRREMLAEEGMVCMQCGKSVSSIVHMCDECFKEHIQECETDITEHRTHDENGTHIQITINGTGEVLDEFDTVSIHDVPTPKNLIEIARMGKRKRLSSKGKDREREHTRI